MRFEIDHHDHGVTSEQVAYVCAHLASEVTRPGPFSLRVELPSELEGLPNGLHGPACGDDPVKDEEVILFVRPPRTYMDRGVHRPVRQVSYVHTFGILDESGLYAIKTIFGGPLAPRHPEDLDCEDVEASRKFWSVHALSLPEEVSI